MIDNSVLYGKTSELTKETITEIKAIFDRLLQHTIYQQSKKNKSVLAAKDQSGVSPAPTSFDYEIDYIDMVQTGRGIIDQILRYARNNPEETTKTMKEVRLELDKQLDETEKSGAPLSPMKIVATLARTPLLNTSIEQLLTHGIRYVMESEGRAAAQRKFEDRYFNEISSLQSGYTKATPVSFKRIIPETFQKLEADEKWSIKTFDELEKELTDKTLKLTEGKLRNELMEYTQKGDRANPIQKDFSNYLQITDRSAQNIGTALQRIYENLDTLMRESKITDPKLRQIWAKVALSPLRRLTHLKKDYSHSKYSSYVLRESGYHRSPRRYFVDDQEVNFDELRMYFHETANQKQNPDYWRSILRDETKMTPRDEHIRFSKAMVRSESRIEHQIERTILNPIKTAAKIATSPEALKITYAASRARTSGYNLDRWTDEQRSTLEMIQNKEIDQEDAIEILQMERNVDGLIKVLTVETDEGGYFDRSIFHLKIEEVLKDPAAQISIKTVEDFFKWAVVKFVYKDGTTWQEVRTRKSAEKVVKLMSDYAYNLITQSKKLDDPDWEDKTLEEIMTQFGKMILFEQNNTKVELVPKEDPLNP